MRNNIRGSRQGSTPDDDVPLDIGSIAAAGERCIDKVVMVQETEYDGKFNQNSIITILFEML